MTGRDPISVGGDSRCRVTAFPFDAPQQGSPTQASRPWRRTRWSAQACVNRLRLLRAASG